MQRLTSKIVHRLISFRTVSIHTLAEKPSTKEAKKVNRSSDKEESLNNRLEQLQLNDEDSIDKPIIKKNNKWPQPTNPRFQAELASTPISILHPLLDLGYYTWKPSGREYRALQNESAAKIRSQIEAEGQPDLLVKPSPESVLPQAFCHNIPSQSYANTYPLGQIDIASLSVAADRLRAGSSDSRVGVGVGVGNSIKTLDFAFGGSTLNMLARCSASSKNEYAAVQVPGTCTVLVVKSQQYRGEYAARGHQFERFVTGRAMSDRHVVEWTEHLQVYQIGDSYKVLMRGETDAQNDEGEPVEVKASHPRNWQTKVAFQMMSSGSPQVCVGVVEYPRNSTAAVLTEVQDWTLGQVAERAFSKRNVQELQDNILEGMDALKEQIQDYQEGEVTKVTFKDGQLRLKRPRKEIVLLPSVAVVKELLLAGNGS